MKEGTRNLLVGTFLTASFAALGILMVLFGEAPSWLGGGEWDLRITNVENLSGLAEGSPVVLNGVEIGRVKRLEFEDPSRPHQGVVIVAGIKNTFEVPQSAVARVYGATLGFGSGHVDIICEPVGGVEPLDRELADIPGSMSSPFDDIISSALVTSIETAIQNIGSTAAATTPVMENISALTQPRSAADVDNPDTPADQAHPTVAT
ncbi:MAG: MCE family protein, partial [Planctomycetes bacterium]|nr:MCE family protein [Planctomycetota bacterium]